MSEEHDEPTKFSLKAGMTPEVAVLRRPPQDHDIYAAIGRVVCYWSHVEHELDLIIWDLLKIDHGLGSCVAEQIMGVPPRFTLITALLRQCGLETLASEATTLTGKIDNLGQKRNRFAHDAWFIEVDDQELYQDKHYSRGKIRGKRFLGRLPRGIQPTITVQEVADFASKIDEAITTLREFRAEISKSIR